MEDNKVRETELLHRQAEITAVGEIQTILISLQRLCGVGVKLLQAKKEDRISSLEKFQKEDDPGSE